MRSFIFLQSYHGDTVKYFCTRILSTISKYLNCIYITTFTSLKGSTIFWLYPSKCRYNSYMFESESPYTACKIYLFIYLLGLCSPFSPKGTQVKPGVPPCLSKINIFHICKEFVSEKITKDFNSLHFERVHLWEDWNVFCKNLRFLKCLDGHKPTQCTR